MSLEANRADVVRVDELVASRSKSSNHHIGSLATCFTRRRQMGQRPSRCCQRIKPITQLWNPAASRFAQGGPPDYDQYTGTAWALNGQVHVSTSAHFRALVVVTVGDAPGVRRRINYMPFGDRSQGAPATQISTPTALSKSSLEYHRPWANHMAFWPSYATDAKQVLKGTLVVHGASMALPCRQVPSSRWSTRC